MSSTAPAMLCEVSYLGQGHGSISQDLNAEILNVLPIAILQLDVNGRIAKHNSYVEELLGKNLVGTLWCEVIHQYIKPQEDDDHELMLHTSKRVWLQTFLLPQNNGQVVLIVDMAVSRQYQDTNNHQKQLITLGEMLTKQAQTPSPQRVGLGEIYLESSMRLGIMAYLRFPWGRALAKEIDHE
jgi:PAS domain-containing protein